MTIAAEREMVFRTWAKAMCTNDVDAYLSCFNDDLFLEDIALARVVEGKDQLRSDVTRWFDTFHDQKLTLEGFLEGAAGEIAARWTLSATLAGRTYSLTENAIIGRHFIKRGISVFTFSASDRFQSETSYWDLNTVIRQIT